MTEDQEKELKAIAAALAAPFPPDDVEWRVGSTNQDKTRGLALAYISNRAIQQRLDDVVGPWGWRNEFTSGPGGGVLCGISVYFGPEIGWVTKFDGAENTDFESVKGGLSDSMKRAGYQWGIGRYLYKLPSVWMACEARGKAVYLKETPELPAWALPEGYVQKKPARKAETKKEATRTAADFVEWAKTHFNVTDPELAKKHIGAALKAAGMTKFDVEKWDEMVVACGSYTPPTE
jgi:hypothetical protein